MTEVEIINSLPREIISRIAGTGRPDANGMVGKNRNGWLHVSFQRGAMLYLSVASSYADEKRTKDAWRAIDAAFRKQTPEGNFLSGEFKGKKPSLGDDLSGTSFWLGELCHTILIVRESKLEPLFEDRINELLPKIQKTADWLARNKDTLLAYDCHAPNRLFFDAQAFGFSGILLNNDDLKQLGKEFADAGLRLQRNDGVFLEKGGHDSSYQAVALLKLQYYAIRFPCGSFEDAINRGTEWEMGRIKPNGEVDVSGNTRTGLGQEKFMGRAKDVNYSEVILSLLYYSARTGNKKASETAENIYQYVLTQVD